MSSYQIFFFSLTGNTRKLADVVSESLRQAGFFAAHQPIDITRFKVQENVMLPPAACKATHYFLFAPTHCQRAPAPLYWALQRLVAANPTITGKPWAVSVTCALRTMGKNALPHLGALVAEMLSPSVLHPMPAVPAPTPFAVGSFRHRNLMLSMSLIDMGPVCACAIGSMRGMVPDPDMARKVTAARKRLPKLRESSFIEYGKFFRCFRRPDRSSPAVIDRCTGCGKCVEVCPEGCLEVVKGKVHVVESASCLNCAACFNVCPVSAIRIHHEKRQHQYAFDDQYLSRDRVLIHIP